MQYKVGSIITYMCYGETRVVQVTKILTMDKDGIDGFDGILVDAENASVELKKTVWGYNRQVIEVNNA